jgi:hypothetical protein
MAVLPSPIGGAGLLWAGSWGGWPRSIARSPSAAEDGFLFSILPLAVYPQLRISTRSPGFERLADSSPNPRPRLTDHTRIRDPVQCSLRCTVHQLCKLDSSTAIGWLLVRARVPHCSLHCNVRHEDFQPPALCFGRMARSPRARCVIELPRELK